MKNIQVYSRKQKGKTTWFRTYMHRDTKISATKAKKLISENDLKTKNDLKASTVGEVPSNAVTFTIYC